MKIEFTLNSPPFSINNAYNTNHTRNRKCRKWGDNILEQLQAEHIQKQLLELHYQKPKSLSVSLRFLYPKDYLYTKSSGFKDISKRSMDLSNIEKLLIDLIFDSRFNERGLKTGKGIIEITNLNLDDKLITRLCSSKELSPSGLHQIHVSIENNV